MCSAISEADAFKVAHTHGREGLDKVIEALRAFKVAVSPELDRRARSDWESALARTRRLTVELLQRVYCWYAQERPHSL